MKKLLLYAGFMSIIIFTSLNAYAETTTIICDYKKYAAEDGIHAVKDKFTLTFVVDKEKGVAYILGNQGSVKVTMLSSGTGLTFIEITTAGNVMTTTIDSQGNTVHSRNTVITGKLVPTQYYGKYETK